MDIRKVKKLIELLDESGIAEIEIKEGEESVRISRYAAGAPAAMAAPELTSSPAFKDSLISHFAAEAITDVFFTLRTINSQLSPSSLVTVSLSPLLNPWSAPVLTLTLFLDLLTFLIVISAP